VQGAHKSLIRNFQRHSRGTSPNRRDRQDRRQEGNSRTQTASFKEKRNRLPIQGFLPGNGKSANSMNPPPPRLARIFESVGGGPGLSEVCVRKSEFGTVLVDAPLFKKRAFFVSAHDRSVHRLEKGVGARYQNCASFRFLHTPFSPAVRKELVLYENTSQAAEKKKRQFEGAFKWHRHFLPVRVSAVLKTFAATAKSGCANSTFRNLFNPAERILTLWSGRSVGEPVAD